MIGSTESTVRRREMSINYADSLHTTDAHIDLSLPIALYTQAATQTQYFAHNAAQPDPMDGFHL